MTGDTARWRKSSHSMATECVEVGGWRKSRYSGSNGDCIEVGSGPAVIAVRDTKLAESPVLTFGAASWQAFVAQVKAA